MSDDETTEHGAGEAPIIPPTNVGKAAKRVDSATLLAELEAGQHAKPAQKKPAKEPEEEDPSEQKPETDDAEPEGEDQAAGAAADDDAEDDEDAGAESSDDDAEDDDAEDDDVDPEFDPATAKRLAAVQKQEKRFREQLKRAREENAAFVEEWKPKIEAAKRFEALKGRAKYAPEAILSELGVAVDDYEAVARRLYALSKAGAADPRNREASERMMRERETNDVVSQLKKQVEDLNSKLEARDKDAEAREATNHYLGQVTKAVSDEAPLVQARLSKAPEKTRHRLHQIAVELAEETGDAPDPLEVVAHLEARLQEELEEMGIDPATVAKKKPAAPTANGKPARTLGKVAGGATPPAKKSPANRDALFEDLRSDLNSGKF